MIARISESGRSRKCRRRVRRVTIYVEPGRIWRGRDIRRRFARAVPKVGAVIPRGCGNGLTDIAAGAAGPPAAVPTLVSRNRVETATSVGSRRRVEAATSVGSRSRSRSFRAGARVALSASARTSPRKATAPCAARWESRRLSLSTKSALSTARNASSTTAPSFFWSCRRRASGMPALGR